MYSCSIKEVVYSDDTRIQASMQAITRALISLFQLQYQTHNLLQSIFSIRDYLIVSCS